MVGDGARDGYCLRSCGACDDFTAKDGSETISACNDFDDDCAWW